MTYFSFSVSLFEFLLISNVNTMNPFLWNVNYRFLEALIFCSQWKLNYWMIDSFHSDFSVSKTILSCLSKLYSWFWKNQDGREYHLIYNFNTTESAIYLMTNGSKLLLDIRDTKAFKYWNKKQKTKIFTIKQWMKS
jgi:hypothetical protein